VKSIILLHRGGIEREQMLLTLKKHVCVCVWERNKIREVR